MAALNERESALTFTHPALATDQCANTLNVEQGPVQMRSRGKLLFKE